MRRKGIKNIIFDFGGVLINLNRQRCIDNFEQLGLDVEAMISPSAHEGIFMELEKGLITPAEFRNAIRMQTEQIVADKRIDAAWNSLLEDISSNKLELLLKLREKYLVYLLSNTNEIHWKWSCANAFPYRTFREPDYFEQTFLSYEMKMAKPDIQMFESVLEETGILPKETFFIDDSEANCAAAESLGILTYHCKPGEDWTQLFK